MIIYYKLIIRQALNDSKESKSQNAIQAIVLNNETKLKDSLYYG